VIVVDASAILELLMKTPSGEAVAGRVFEPGQRMHAPHLLDLEAAQVLRRIASTGKVAVERCRAALDVLSGLRILRYPHYALLPRIWELRHNLTAYDATYVALAEALDAPLLTRDSRIARAPGHRAQIDLLGEKTRLVL
jgi:predicted nucleic acid-binding protein